MSTKELILKEALKQFSEKGYAGTSMSDIAAPLGISKAALYKHFRSKQEIFEQIIEESERRSGEMLHHLSVRFTDGEADAGEADYYGSITAETLTENVLEYVMFTMTDEYARQVRHMLILSQFQNKELAKLYTKRYVEAMFHHDEMLFAKLMERGGMKKGDPKQMALYFYAPVLMYMGIWDRDPRRKEECVEAIRTHVKNFFEMTK